MEYNKTMRAMAQDAALLRKADRNPLVCIVFLMNEYHACSLRYFSDENARKEMKSELEREIRRLGKNRRVPAHVRGKVGYWLNNPSAWRDDIDQIMI